MRGENERPRQCFRRREDATGAKIPLTSILCSELQFEVRGVCADSAPLTSILSPKGRGRGIRGRQGFRRRRSFGGRVGGTRPPYMFLRNEPILFSGTYSCIAAIYNNL